MNNSPDPAALLGLQDSLRNLTAALQQASLAVEQVLSSQPFRGDWVLVSDGYNPLPVPLREILNECYELRTAEEGPPDTPTFLAELARDHLTGNPSLFELRATEAFEAGFWIKISIETETAYRSDEDRVAFEPKHWLIFSRRGAPFHCRVTSRRCLQVLLQQEPGAIVESFETLCELNICCVGAQQHVPALRKWISQQ